MADASIDVYEDQFTNISEGPSATMLVIPISSGLTKNSTLTINEIDSLSVATGRYITGVCAAIASGEFYNLPSGYNQYYINPINPPQRMYLPSLFKQNTVLSLTGTTVNTIIYSVLLPAGTFRANDFLRFFAKLQGSNNANNKIVRAYFNTSVSLTGATVAARINFTNGNANIGYSPLVRSMTFLNSLVSQSVPDVTGSFFSDEAAVNNSANTALAVDFTVDQYFIIAGQLSSAADVVSLLSLYGYIVR